jgi:hypothetical protein
MSAFILSMLKDVAGTGVPVLGSAARQMARQASNTAITTATLVRIVVQSRTNVVSAAHDNTAGPDSTMRFTGVAVALLLILVLGETSDSKRSTLLQLQLWLVAAQFVGSHTGRIAGVTASSEPEVGNGCSTRLRHTGTVIRCVRQELGHPRMVN